MKRQLAIWLSLCLLLVRCNSDTDLGAEPENLIDEPTMANILTEVHLSEAKISKMGIVSSDTSTLLFRRLQAKTLKKFDVDTAAYAQSFAYYSARPARLTVIYEQVVEKLKAVEKEKTAKAGKSKLKPTP